MLNINNLFYIFRCFGFRKFSLYILSLPIRFIYRYNSVVVRYKNELRSHLKIKEVVENSVLSEIESIPGALVTEIKEFHSRFRLPVNTLWHKFFITLNGIEKAEYLSEGNFYTYIEPRLNHPKMVTAYADKNVYQKIIPLLKQPRTILRYINGRFYNENYTELTNISAGAVLFEEKGTMICKPSIQSGRGRNIFRLTANNNQIKLNGSVKSLHDLKMIYPAGFILQESLRQHSVLSAIHPESLNTLRVTTLRFEEQILVLSALLKMGNEGHYLDKMVTGGLVSGIREDGRLYDFAYDNSFNKHYEHPSTGVQFSPVKIPSYDDVKRQVVDAHKTLHYFDMISWDMAISEHAEPVLVELNLRNQGILYQQAIFGPLFGDLTEKVFEQFTGH